MMTSRRKRPAIAFGLLGPELDAATGPKGDRWAAWRPTVDLVRHDALPLARLELLHDRRYAPLAETVAADAREIAPATEVRLHPLDLADPWDFEEAYARLHDFATGYPFDPEAEDYLVHLTTGTHVLQICLFLLTESRHLPARLVQTVPPSGDDPGAPGTFVVIDLDLSRYDRLAARFETEERDAVEHLKSGIETRNVDFERMIGEIERVAVRSREPVLLLGPTGAGKTLLGRRIYELRRRRGLIAGPFVEVNCATIHGDQAMSTLFGHVKGAFTGALADRKGMLRAADGGVLFLDEIGELGPDEQAMLLRALEEKSFYPLGADREVHSDFQLLCGSNRDLATEVDRGRFREDLLARINLWTFRLPPLRERREDIPGNLDWELEKVGRGRGEKVSIGAKARQELLAFATSPEALWPGNFRDFNAAVIRLATLAPCARIGVGEVRAEIARLRAAWSRTGSGTARSPRLERLLGREALAELDEFDRVQLEHVVAVCAESASLSAAGRRLFAASRRRRRSRNDADRLRKYLARYGLSWDRVAPR